MLLQLQAYILINGANYRIQARVHRSGLTIVERRKHLLTDSTQKKHFFQTRILAFLKKFQVQSNLNPPSSFVINRITEKSANMEHLNVLNMQEKLS